MRYRPHLMWTILLFLGFGSCKDVRPPLLDIWNSYDSGPTLDRWEEYSELYQDLFESYKIGGSIKFLEIGVQSGGSLITWNYWFGDSDFTYVGIDINPLCKQFENEEDKNYVEIGSQADPVFLQSVCEKHGPFDIIIDDGGHTAEQIITSLRTLYPCVVEGGFYVIEDLASTEIFPLEWALYENKTVAQHIAKIYESKLYYFSKIGIFASTSGLIQYDPIFSDYIKKITMVDGMIAIERKRTYPMTKFVHGTITIPHSAYKRMTLALENQVVEFDVYIGENSDLIDKKRTYSECYAKCQQIYSTSNVWYDEQVLIQCAKDTAYSALNQGYHYRFDGSDKITMESLSTPTPTAVVANTNETEEGEGGYLIEDPVSGRNNDSHPIFVDILHYTEA